MTEPSPFVAYLESLRDNRSALAQLRRGLGRPPGTVPDTYPYVVPWLPPGTRRWHEDAYYLLASLFAYHPAAGGTGNMGNHFRLCLRDAQDATAIERRFMALLAAHPDDLPFFLRQAVSFLCAKEVPVAWNQLLIDLLRWSHPDRYVQRNWAHAFWAGAHQVETTTEEEARDVR